MPYTTVQKKITGFDLHPITSWCRPHPPPISTWLSTKCEDASPVQQPASSAEATEDDDFVIRSTNRHCAEAQALKQSRVLTLLLLPASPPVSLLVGGIGIMNIMLVSVTERTREIGLRMAIGATKQAVELQFLCEATVAQHVPGSLLGIFFGSIASFLVSQMLHWTTGSFASASILIAALFSAGVGMFFGFFPARRAAHLHPVEALRFE